MSYYIISLVPIKGIIGFIIHGIIITVIVSIIFFITTFKKKDFAGLKEKIERLIKNRKENLIEK